MRLLLITLLLVTGLSSCCTSGKNGDILPTLPNIPLGSVDTVRGVSAPFAGAINGDLYVAGGCNFPEPVRLGGKKRFYSDIFKFTKEQNKWEIVGKLPQELAYGGSVVWNDQWFCVGGQSPAGLSRSVYRIRWEQGTLSVDTLPELPIAFDNCEAVIEGTVIYVIGTSPTTPSKKGFYKYDLSHGESWVSLPDYPGESRQQGRIFRGRTGQLVLIGGFESGVNNCRPKMPTNFLAYDIASEQWSVEGELPKSKIDNETLSMVGGFGSNVGDSLIVIAGGVDRSIFMEALDRPRMMKFAKEIGSHKEYKKLKKADSLYLHRSIKWFNFNQEVFAYHIKQKTWTTLGRSPQVARAGAGVIVNEDKFYILGGELMPGIRSDMASYIDLKR